MFILKELELINFRSWKHLLLENIDKKGLLLISGPNGGGKSSLRLAIEYLLLDRTSESIPVEELPRNRGKNCIIRGVFKKGEDVIEITKYRNHYKNTNKIILSINDDTQRTKSDRRETQKEIEELFNISPDMLFISSSFSTNSPSFPSSQDAIRKQILYDALNLNRYNVWSSRAKGRIDDCETVIKECEYKIKEKEKLMEEKESLLVKYSVACDSYEDSRSLKVKNIEEKIETAKLKIKDIIKYNNAHIKLGKQLIKFGVDDDEKINEVNKELQSMNESRIRYELIIKDCEREKKDLLNGNCPILNDKCDRLLNKEKCLEFELNNKLKETKNKLRGINKCINIYNKELKLLDDITNKIDKVKDKMLFIKNKIYLILNENDRIENYIKELRETIEDYSNEDNPYIDMVNRIKEEIEDADKQNKEHTKILLSSYDDLKYYLFFKKSFSKTGIPSMLIDGILESIEFETNDILSSIDGNIVVQITPTTEKGKEVRDKIFYKVFEGGEEKSFASLSGGEKQRVKLADMFAFSQVLGKFSFLCLDEVLEGSLDSSGKSSTIHLLKSMANKISTMLVISHDSQIKDSFQNVMTIRKVNGVSKC